VTNLLCHFTILSFCINLLRHFLIVYCLFVEKKAINVIIKKVLFVEKLNHSPHLSLRVVEVRRDGDDSLRDGVAEESVGGLLHPGGNVVKLFHRHLDTE
jgi:hypothetical protein